MIAVCVPYGTMPRQGVLTVTHTSTLHCSADDYDMSLCFSTSLLNIIYQTSIIDSSELQRHSLESVYRIQLQEKLQEK